MHSRNKLGHLAVMTLRMALFFTIKEGRGKGGSGKVGRERGGGIQDSGRAIKHNGQAENDLFHV